MNLREAMGAVRAGKKVRFHVVTPYGIQALTSEDLEHAEFHVVEEPPRCTDAYSTPACCATRADDRATIARLTRELASTVSVDWQLVTEERNSLRNRVECLTRELAEARAANKPAVLQGSNDGVNWVTLGELFTPGLHRHYRKVRS
jgi:hypothetical protein